MLDNFIAGSDPVINFRIFGFGFLAGSLFAILIMLIFDWLKSKNPDNDKDKRS